MNEEKSEFQMRIYNTCKQAILQLAKIAENINDIALTEKDIDEIRELIETNEQAGFDCTEENLALAKICNIFNKSKTS